MEINDIQDAASCSAINVVLRVRQERRQRKKRAVWVKPWIAARETDGAFHCLLKDLEDDPEHYKNYLRMYLATFEELLLEVEPYLKKQDTLMRKAISPSEQLSAVCLRFLATGESYTSLQYQFHISKFT